MKKLIQIGSALLLFCALFTMTTIQPVYAEDTSITQDEINLVPDAELQKAMNDFGNARFGNGWPTYDAMTQEKFDMINASNFYLKLTDLPIQSLEGIQYLDTEFSVLFLENLQVSDYSPLFQMNQLRALVIQSDTITDADVAKLGSIPNLGELRLITNVDVDLSTFENATELYYMELYGYKERITVRSFESLQKLPVLRQFDLGYVNNTDISAIRDLQALETFGLISAPVQDISTLTTLPVLQNIFLYDTYVSTMPDEIRSIVDYIEGLSADTNTRNWYDAANQNSITAVSNQTMDAQTSMTVEVPIKLHSGGVFDQFLSIYGWQLLTDSPDFGATITSSDPSIATASSTNGTDIVLTSGQKAGTATMTYTLTSGVSFQFDVLVTGGDAGTGLGGGTNGNSIDDNVTVDTISINNPSQSELPQTGVYSIEILAAGIALLLGAGSLLLLKKNK